MLSTALESGDYLMRQTVPGIHHVRVEIPADIAALDFQISKADRQRLFDRGHSASHSAFAKMMPQWREAKDVVESIQALHAPPIQVVAALQAVATAFEDITSATDVRANVMLVTPSGTRIVAYHFGMDGDPDADLELALEGGCSGEAWSRREPIMADLEAAQQDADFLNKWKLTSNQQAKVRTDRKAMVSFPMYDLTRTSAINADELDLIGTLSVDTSTSLSDTGWIGEFRDSVNDLGKVWADILSRVLW
jgi:hypothetical protein